MMSVPVTMTQSGRQLTVSVAAASKGPAAMHGEVWICSISTAVPIMIGRGENGGREVTYDNVVRNLLKRGDWNGTSGSWTVPLEKYPVTASMRRRSIFRTAIATSRVRCWGRPSSRSNKRRPVTLWDFAEWRLPKLNPRLASNPPLRNRNIELGFDAYRVTPGGAA